MQSRHPLPHCDSLLKGFAVLQVPVQQLDFPEQRD